MHRTLVALVYSFSLLLFSMQGYASDIGPLRNSNSKIRPEATISAKAAILINAKTGMILYEKNPHISLFPASTTKIFTALYALEKKGNSFEDPVTASNEAVMIVSPKVRRALDGKHPPYRLEYGGTHMGIKRGEILRYKSLLDGLMLVSANDASNVIAEHVSGDVKTFVEELNAYLYALGCNNTTLTNPHGMPHPEHKTSAHDMALAARRAMQNPYFRELVGQVNAERPMTNMQPASEMVQFNRLLRPGKFYYPKATGIKTGYTDSAGFTLVASAENEERELICVVFGNSEHAGRYRDAIALFESAFNEVKTSRKLFSKGFDRFTKQVDGAKIPIEATLKEDVQITYFPSEEPLCRAEVSWYTPQFPILMDQIVGEVQVIEENKGVILSVPLVATNNVESTFLYEISLTKNRALRAVSKFSALILCLSGLILILVGLRKSRCY